MTIFKIVSKFFRNITSQNRYEPKIDKMTRSKRCAPTLELHVGIFTLRLSLTVALQRSWNCRPAGSLRAPRRVARLSAHCSAPLPPPLSARLAGSVSLTLPSGRGRRTETASSPLLCCAVRMLREVIWKSRVFGLLGLTKKKKIKVAKSS